MTYDHGPQFISSAANPQLKALRKLAQDNTAYRSAGRVWLEGDHLCRAALQRGLQPELAVFSEELWPQELEKWASSSTKIIVIPPALFAGLSALESPARMGCVLVLPHRAAMDPLLNSVVLDRVQDAGNVGSILRSAAAFGFAQVLALKGTAALWSPKVLRSGMGAHFGLTLHEGLDVADLEALQIPLLVTSSHDGALIHEQRLPRPCAWVMGHEGQGVGEGLMQRASLRLRIGQPGGEESLNVAAAAAICLHASASASQP